MESSGQSIALLIPAHNEEAVLEDTLVGALATGLLARDIYLVNDSSTDQTLTVARKILSSKNVVSVNRGGKALALKEGIVHFNLINRYDWVQIIDADSIFSPNYVQEIRKHFHPDVAAVCGQVKSLQHNWITSYRAMEYTIFQDFFKNLQNKFNLVGVMPGPATCFNTRALRQLDISNDTVTEDFDLTIQVHHLQLGRIVYVDSAHSWTQDPPTLPIYIGQVTRWYTGFFQVMKKHKLGRRARAIDFMLLLQMVDGFMYAIQLLTLILIMVLGIRYVDIRAIFAFDFLIMLGLTTYAALRMKRVDVLTPMPTYYVLRFINICLYVWAAIKVLLLPQRIARGGVWNTIRIANAPSSIKTAMKGGGSP